MSLITIAPTFKHATCGSECGCHEYYPKTTSVGDSVTMTVKPVETNLTIRWWTTNVNPIVGNDGRYFLKNNNRVRLIVLHHINSFAYAIQHSS